MLALVLTLLVAVLHVGFMVLETFLWTTPKVRRSFGMSTEDAETTRVLAANQGVYNGALAAALAYAALRGEWTAATILLAFVVVVGLYGAYSARWTILVIQALPAAGALAAILLG
jgi:putative membrane protein